MKNSQLCAIDERSSALILLVKAVMWNLIFPFCFLSYYAYSEELKCSALFPPEANLSEEKSCLILDAIGVDYDPHALKLFDHGIRVCGAINLSAKYLVLSKSSDGYIVILYGNACTSGMAGSDLVIFEKESDGSVRKVAEAVSVSNVEISNSIVDGHNSLIFHGPGLCHAIWIWNNGKYQLSNRICK